MMNLERIAEAAKQEAQALLYYQCLGVQNQPSAPAKRAEAAQEYRRAEAEYMRLRYLRAKLQRLYAQGLPFPEEQNGTKT